MDTDYCPICNQYIGYLPKNCDYLKLKYINEINKLSTSESQKPKDKLLSGS